MYTQQEIVKKTKRHYKNYLAFLKQKKKEDKKKFIEEETKKYVINTILKNSLNSQTEFVPKPSFKEFSKHPVLARITAELETNDHPGYCAHINCSYKSKIINVNTILPEEYSAFCPEIGECIDFKNALFKYNWTKHLPLPNITHYPGNFCECTKTNGVDRHQYRYTLKKIEVIENKFYNKTSTRGYLLIERISSNNNLYAAVDTFTVVDTFTEAKKIAKDKNCKIYELDTLKYIPIKK